MIDIPNSLFDEIIDSIFSEYIKPRDTLIDVGANIGTHTIHLVNQVEKNGKVYAFEPFENNLRELEKKININKLTTRVKTHQMALSNNTGKSDFEIFKDRPAVCGFIERPWYDKSKMEVITVEVDFIDNVFDKIQKIDLIKIDAEGADFDIVKGARKCINYSRPLIVFEGGRLKANPGKLYKYTEKDFREFFKSINYEVYDTFGM